MSAPNNALRAGMPIESLGFPAGADAMVIDDGRGGHDLEVTATRLATSGRSSASRPPQGSHNGVWLSRYEFFSRGRDAAYTGLHHVVVLQHGDRLTVRSLPESADSALALDLTVDGSVVTGTWTEQTDPGGYYRGARYHGAIQLLVEPTGRRMTGKWIGFGTSMEINTGPWTLTFLDASTSKATLEGYSHKPAE